jgi:hypothetical protein
MSQLIPVPLSPPPGVVATESLRTAAGRWTIPWNWMRFIRGKPQKIGGFVLAFAQATSGIPHAILAWTDLIINRYLAAGTYRKLYVYDQNLNQNDITPFRLTGSLTNPFSTTINSSIITVSHSGNGVGAGDQVIFTSVASAVDGITAAQLTGSFVVSNIIDANTYTFDCGVVATSTAGPGGGTVNYEYEINIGTENSSLGLGWGVGPWGQGTWGTPRATSTIVFESRVWSLDHFGKILIASYNGGTVYQFDPTQAQPWPRAQVVSGSPPTDVRSLFVTPERFVVVLRENLVISSSSQGDFNTWTPATNNTAWSRTLTEGTRLVGGEPLMPFYSLVWTDGAVYLLQYTGSQFIYNSSLIARDAGLLGINAEVCANGIAYWMSPNNFLMYSGSVTPIPNVEDIRKYVFDNVNVTQAVEITAFYNPIYDEVWWNIPMFGSQTPNVCVIFHNKDQAWSIHMLTRVSGTHYTSGDTRPYLGDVSGFIYQHEVGFDANGSPITSQMTLAPMDISPGDRGMDNMQIEGVEFDDFQQVGNVSITFNMYDRVTDASPMDTDTETIPSVLAGLTDLRIGGRYVGLSVTQNTLGAYMRWGTPTMFLRSIGRRR